MVRARRHSVRSNAAPTQITPSLGMSCPSVPSAAALLASFSTIPKSGVFSFSHSFDPTTHSPSQQSSTFRCWPRAVHRSVHYLTCIDRSPLFIPTTRLSLSPDKRPTQGTYHTIQFHEPHAAAAAEQYNRHLAPRFPIFFSLRDSWHFTCFNRSHARTQRPTVFDVDREGL
jgi:hypothetical protein